MDFLTPQVIIQGGAITIALAQVWLLHKLITNHYKHTNDVIKRNTDAIIDETKSHQLQADVLNKLASIIDRKL